MLVWFCIRAKLRAQTLRHPCLARSSRCTEYCHPHNHCKRTIIPRPAPPHLPPLSKVRCCRPKKFGRLPEGLLPIRTKPPKTSPSLSLFVMLTSVCTNMFSHPHYPTKTANTLASPRKRGGGTADTNFSLAVQYSDSPAFTILKLFRAVTVGIVSP